MEINLPESVVNQVLAVLDSSKMDFDELVHAAIESYLMVESDAAFIAFLLANTPPSYSQKRKPILRQLRQRDSKFRFTQVNAVRSSRKNWTLTSGGQNA